MVLVTPYLCQKSELYLVLTGLLLRFPSSSSQLTPLFLHSTNRKPAFATGSDVTGLSAKEEAQTNWKLRSESSGMGESSLKTMRQGWGGVGWGRGGVKFKYEGCLS